MISLATGTRLGAYEIIGAIGREKCIAGAIRAKSAKPKPTPA
jgi:hypothetical protein